MWKVPTEFRKRLGDRPGRQRAMFADEHLLLVLHKPPQAGEEERQGRYLWRNPEGAWSSNDWGAGPGCLMRHLNEFSESIQKYDIDEEKAHTSTEYFTVLEGLAPLRRAIGNLHQVLQEARKLVPEDRNLINARDQSYDLERTCDLLYNTAKNGLDFAIARQAEAEATSSRQMAVSAHRLNLLVASFFPLATLSGVFGVNFSHSIEAYVPAPWPIILMIVSGLVMGGILANSIAKSR